MTGIERSRPDHGPHAVFPLALDVVVVGGRPGRARPGDHILRDQIARLPTGIGIEFHRVLLLDQCIGPGRIAQGVRRHRFHTHLFLVVHEFRLMRVHFLVRVTAEHLVTSVEQPVFQHVAIIGHADRIGAMRPPLHQIEKTPRGLDLGDLFRRLGFVPGGFIIGARRRQVLAHIFFLELLAE